MKRILITLLTVAISYCSFSQISQRCPVCPPRQGSSPDSSCLRIVNGVAVWLPCAGSTNDFWSLTGNAGTTAGTNFIGTTDNKDLIFKVASVFSGWIDTGTGNTALGMRALYSTTSAIANVAYGASALQNLTSGRENTAIGPTSLWALLTGRRNVAVGLNSLGAITAADRNTAVGFNSFINLTSGGSNVAIGNKAGDIITNADRCVFLGDSARGTTTGLINSIAIGYNSYVDTSNAMILGNSSVNVGIGVTKPTAKLHVGGNFRLVDGTQSAGYVLTSDADGNASWQQHISKVDLTNQTASITTTNISGTDSAGFYLLDFYLVNSVADGTAGNVTITITWNDGVAARTITSSALALTSNGFINHVTGATTENAIYKNGSGPIQFSTTATTVNSAAYDLHIRVEDGN